MFEQPEEIAKREVLRPHALHDQLGVMAWQGAGRAEQAEEVDNHFRRFIDTRLAQLRDLAGRKRQRLPRAEMHCFIARRVVATDRPTARIQTLQQPHGLKEAETRRVGEQLIAERDVEFAWRRRPG